MFPRLLVELESSASCKKLRLVLFLSRLASSMTSATRIHECVKHQSVL